MTAGLQILFERLGAARARREPLRAGETDALRIVDGKGDRCGDLEIDDFAGRWLVQTRGSEFPDWLPEVPGPRSLYWKKLGEPAVPRWMSGEKLTEPFVVCENGLRYQIDFAAGYSQGLFLDQRENRRCVHVLAGGKTVLNCFAYTCAFGVSAAAGGGMTTNLDLSRPSLEWGRVNYALNNLDPAAHEFIFGDVANWLERFARKGRCFDMILLDPPSFSRNDRGAVFRVEEDFGHLVRAAEQILAPKGRLFCSTNLRRLSRKAFRALIISGLTDPKAWNFAHIRMPPDFRGEQYLQSLWLVRR